MDLGIDRLKPYGNEGVVFGLDLEHLTETAKFWRVVGIEASSYHLRYVRKFL